MFLFHITRIQSLLSIAKEGLFCPSKAETRGCVSVLGAEGSNVAVVQMYDLNGYSQEQLENVLMEFSGHSDLAAVLISPMIRTVPQFIDHTQAVKQAEQSGIDRVYPHFEVWWRGEVLPPQDLAGCCALRDLWHRLKSTPGS